MPEILPDSTARNPKGVQRGFIEVPGSAPYRVNWQMLYCISCGREYGMVPETLLTNELGQSATALCQKCANQYGDLLAPYMTPDEVVWQKCHEAMLENDGRILEPHEIADALLTETHYLAKLKRERGDHLRKARAL